MNKWDDLGGKNTPIFGNTQMKLDDLQQLENSMKTVGFHANYPP